MTTRSILTLTEASPQTCASCGRGHDLLACALSGCATMELNTDGMSSLESVGVVVTVALRLSLCNACSAQIVSERRLILRG
jgi:hypothetical protein